MNSVNLIGNAVEQPRVCSTQSGTAVAHFRIGVTLFSRGGEKRSLFLPVDVFGREAEYVSRYVSKGTRLAVSGSLDMDDYAAKDGTRRTVTKIIASAVDVLQSSGGYQQQGGYQQGYQQQGCQQQGYQQQGYRHVDDSDLRRPDSSEMKPENEDREPDPPF